MISISLTLTLHSPFQLSSIFNEMNGYWRVTVYQKIEGSKSLQYFGVGRAKDLNEALTLAIEDSMKFRRVMEGTNGTGGKETTDDELKDIFR